MARNFFSKHSSFCLCEGAFESHGSYNVLQNIFLTKVCILYVGEEAKSNSQV